MQEPITFKFRPLDNHGNQTGFLSKKGAFDGSVLSLGKHGEYPTTAILGATSRLDRLILAARLPENEEESVVAIVVYSGKLKALLQALNLACSEQWAVRRKAKLQEAGQENEFRMTTCTHCSCSVDLTSRAETPQAHCPYCDAFFTLDADAPEANDPSRAREESQLRLCDKCGYYSKPRDFTTFYFYFLLVVYGWRYHKSNMCNTCMRSQGWKMLFVNFFFILGIPMSVIQLCRAYFGGTSLSGNYKGLDSANALAKERKPEKAILKYEIILERIGHSAGVRYNQGLAMLERERVAEAAEHFIDALSDCSNYEPAAQSLAACYHHLGMKDEFEALKAEWEHDPAGQQEENQHEQAVPAGTE